MTVAWVAHYLHFQDFGFYEDDWYYFAHPYLRTPDHWFSQLQDEVVKFQLGRPIQNVFMYTFGYIGVIFSSIAVTYLFAFLFLALSVALGYRVLKVRFPSAFAGFASLIFLLSPLTTLKQHLNLALTTGPGFCFLFVAFLLYSRGRRILAHLAAVAALLTYEPLFFLYGAAPFFRNGARRRRLREIAAHSAICASILAIYALLRWHFSEARMGAVTSGPLATLAPAIVYCARFTVASLQCYARAAWIGFGEIGGEAAGYCALFLAAAFWLSRRDARRSAFGRARRWWWLWNGVGSGVVLAALGFTLAYFQVSLDQNFSFPLSGRDTRVSAAASFGGSIAMAGALWLLQGSRAKIIRMLGGTLALAMLAVLFLYSFAVQRDYVKAWADQKNIVAGLIRLTPDAHRDSFFIVRTSWIVDTVFPRGERRLSIGYSLHGLQLSLRALFGWNSSPDIFFVYSDDWVNNLELRADGKLYWIRESFPGGWNRKTTEPLTPSRIVVMSVDKNWTLARHDQPVIVDGVQIVQMPPRAGEPHASNWRAFRPTRLIREMLPPALMPLVGAP